MATPMAYKGGAVGAEAQAMTLLGLKLHRPIWWPAR
jgi:hypothetical protein